MALPLPTELGDLTTTSVLSGIRSVLITRVVIGLSNALCGGEGMLPFEFWLMVSVW